MKKGHPLAPSKQLRFAITGSTALALLAMSYSSFAATATWTGGGADGNWSTSGNWTAAAPATSGSDAIVFAGTTNLTTNNDYTANTLFNGITFNSGAGAFTLNGNAINLGGDIVNNSTSLQTINLSLALTANRSVNAASGNIAIGGVISGAFALTKSGANTLTLTGANAYTAGTTISAGTLKLGANNALPTAGAVTLSSGGTSNTLDLAGFSQTITTLTSSSTNNSGGTVTSSAAGGSLTLNEGTANGNIFGGTLFTGSLALTIRGNNANNLQIQNTANTFSGGLTIQSTGAALTTSNLATAGGLTGQATEGVRSSTAAALSTGTITLDNGQLFLTASQNVSNNLSVTANGGVLHMESTGSTATGGFTGALSSTNSTLLVVNSNSGNANIVKFSGDMSAFKGTLALDTTNIGGIALSGSAFGNSNINLLWFGNGTNGGTGRVQANNATSQTYTFGELNNLNSGSVGSTMSGIIENNVAATTATFSIGDNNSTAATFQGVIRNGSGTVALTKSGSNTQILSGANTYTGATTVNGGTLNIKGSLAAGSTVTVNSGGTLAANGLVSGTVAVNGGGALAGTGTVSGVVTLATGGSSSTQGSINLVDGSIGTLTLSNAAGLTLGDGSGGASKLTFELGTSSSDLLSLGANALTLNSGGAIISLSSLGAVANQTYNILSFGSGTGAGFATGSGTTVGGLTLASSAISFGVTGSLNVTANQVQVVTSGASAPATAYWSGVKGTNWSDNDGTNGNFTTDQAGTNFIQAYPAATTDVFFAKSGTTSNTLGQTFDIKSLSFLNGAGAATVGGTNTLQVEAGGITVQAGNGGAALAMNNLALGADQTWTNNANLVVSAPISGAHALTITGAGNTTLSGADSFTGGLAILGSGTTVLSGAKTYSGGTTLSGAGTVQLGSASALGSASGALAVNSGTLDLNNNSVTVGALSGTGSGAVITTFATGTATLTVNTTGTSTYSGSMNDGGSGAVLAFTKSGAGTLALTGSSNHTGANTLSAGTVQIGSPYALGNAATTIASGATLDLNGQAISQTLNVSGTGASGVGALLNSNTASAASVNSDITNGVGFTVGGAGDIVLQRARSGGSPFTVTKIGNGTLTLGNANTSAHFNLLALDVESGTVNLGTTSGSFIAIDRGLIINNGTVRYTGSSTNFISDSSVVTVNGGLLDFNGKSDTVAQLNGTGGVVANNSATASTSTLTLSATGSTTYSGSIQDNSVSGGGVLAIVKTGTGVQVFSGSNSYAGTTTISSGTLVLANANAVQKSVVSLGVANGLAFNSGIGTFNVGGLSGSGSQALVDTASGGVTVQTGGAGTQTYSGALSGAGSLNINGAGTQILTGANTYTGATTISAGTLQLGDGANANGSVTGNIVNNSALTVANGNTQTISNAISGSGSLTKSGTGTVILSGALSYSGATNVNAGTLILDGVHNQGSGTNSGRYIVSSGATLGGNGSIILSDSNAGLTGLSVAGTFAPGDNSVDNGGGLGIGTFTINAANSVRSAVAFEGGGKFSFQLNTVGGVAFSDELLLTGGKANSIFFNNNVINFADLSGGALNLGNYTLFSVDAANAYSGLTLNGSIITGGLTVGTGLENYSATLALSGNDIVLELAAVPEPATWSMILGGLGMLAFSQSLRRNRRS